MKSLQKIIATVTLIPVLSIPCYADKQSSNYQRHSYSSQYQSVKPPRKVDNNYSNKKMSPNEKALRNAGSLGGAVKGAVSPSNISGGLFVDLINGINKRLSYFFTPPKNKKSQSKPSK